MNLIEFTESTETVTEAKPIKTNCNTITVINIGTASAQLDSIPLAPGDQYVSQGNAGEINRTTYNAAFTSPGTQVLLVIRKTYR